MVNQLKSATVREEQWPLWASAVMAGAAILLCVGGVVGALYAKQDGSLLLGLVAAAVGVLLLAQVPGPSSESRER